MEAVEDDICILKHETAYGGAGESPVSVCAGDESVASHFALVTAYEDIKKRLRDTERENTLLRKRVKQLEDKLFRPEAPSPEGPQYVNKAFSAYRGIYIEKEDLQLELNKLKREKMDSERLLNEQLQAKEMELLQLKTEMETSQVMKSLTSTQDYWQVDRVNSELKIHTLQEELERMTLENSRLQGHCGDSAETSGSGCDQNHMESNQRVKAVLQSYEALASEIFTLHSVLKQQSDLVKKLRDKPLNTASKLASPTIPVQCLDDVEKNQNHRPVRVSVPRSPSAPPVPSSSGRPCLPPVGPPALEGLREDCWQNGPWSGALGLGSTSPVLLPPPPLNQPSLDDSSWSFPSPPKPSDALFWAGQNQGLGHGSPSHSSRGSASMSPNGDWAKPPPY
ncbi:5-azacytidine-induced protein 2 [Esox lucius]|uniref:Tbk1/Ikki binding domain-containing protein n=1 Tax=Esox lucius TaxID=8010 RepID=A0A3P8ZDY8_ESOLU|nr:5-azacytidine-induced protein 2 [Esox lucius]XP_010891043.1 5-azacytidine-induced protein 2 [Esox lucius]XP_010891044.1 5-azacytidine-induced protein 2 [Esox lucius]XP_010891045.1 5-azacytidine-induced protein 2 [Esox lucius]